MFQTEVVQKIETHILRSIHLFRKSYQLWENVGKHGITGQARIQTHTHLIFNTYCTIINSVWPCKMIYGNTYKNWETMQELICHYDLLSPTASEDGHEQTNVFCFGVAFICEVWLEYKLAGLQFISKTGTYNLHCCWWQIYHRSIIV